MPDDATRLCGTMDAPDKPGHDGVFPSERISV